MPKTLSPLESQYVADPHSSCSGWAGICAQGPVMCPTRPPGDSSNACANAAWVKANGGGRRGPAIGNAITGATANYGLYSDSASKLGQFAMAPASSALGLSTGSVGSFLVNGGAPAPPLSGTLQCHRPAPHHRRNRHPCQSLMVVPAHLLRPLTAGTNITITGTWLTTPSLLPPPPTSSPAPPP